jgi:hypothetical protein
MASKNESGIESRSGERWPPENKAGIESRSGEEMASRE